MAKQQPDELIIVDDHSTDRSIELIKELQKQYKIKLVINDGPQGIFNAFIKGCQSTDAEWVCSLGCDDEVAPDFIDRMKNTMSKYPLTDIYTCNAKIIREGKEYARVLLPFDAYLSPDYMVKICSAGLGKMINLIGMVIKKQVVLDMWENGAKVSNTDFDAAFAYYMIFDKGLVNTAEKLITFRSYPNSLGATGKTKEKKKAEAIAKNLFSKKPIVYNRAVKSKIWAFRYQFAQKIALWGIMKLPKWAREMFYRWFYQYHWSVEKL